MRYIKPVKLKEILFGVQSQSGLKINFGAMANLHLLINNAPCQQRRNCVFNKTLWLRQIGNFRWEHLEGDCIPRAVIQSKLKPFPDTFLYYY